MKLLKRPIGAALALSFLFLYTGCDNENGQSGGSGFLEAEEVLITAESNGRVIERYFNEGDKFSEGDTLLIIDPSRLELDLVVAEASRAAAETRLRSARIQREQAEETVRYASQEYERLKSLLPSGSATKRQVDELVHQHEVASLSLQAAESNIKSTLAEIDVIDANIAQVKRKLQDCYPIAPVSGTIIEKFVEVGELLSAGRPIAKIAQIDTMWVKVYLPADEFAQVKIGDTVTVDTEAGGEKFRGTIIWTTDEAEFTPKNTQTKKSRANLVYAVKVQVANPKGNLKIGMPVYVSVGL
jgi:HlyD family secretion protein